MKDGRHNARYVLGTRSSDVASLNWRSRSGLRRMAVLMARLHAASMAEATGARGLVGWLVAQASELCCCFGREGWLEAVICKRTRALQAW